MVDQSFTEANLVGRTLEVRPIGSDKAYKAEVLAIYKPSAAVVKLADEPAGGGFASGLLGITDDGDLYMLRIELHQKVSGARVRAQWVD